MRVSHQNRPHMSDCLCSEALQTLADRAKECDEHAQAHELSTYQILNADTPNFQLIRSSVVVSRYVLVTLTFLHCTLAMVAYQRHFLHAAFRSFIHAETIEG